MILAGSACLYVCACTTLHDLDVKKAPSPSDAEIWKFLPGVWALDFDRSNNEYPFLITFGTNQTFIKRNTLENREASGIWFATNSLIILHWGTNTPQSQWHFLASMGEGENWPVISLSENEMKCGPGISVAGRLIFHRSSR
jgi:hypothetical protein